ncbi:golgin subfamily A member 4-like isoform X4 [Branchiostoma lanceolatum]|uniref:golgin subfamily A member 4-like isoform X4 n=1 Tax=Branchiostoma lanceolatum TaxID=7740 RepID=UPI003452014B
MAFNRSSLPSPTEMTIASLRNSVDILQIENTSLKADLERERGVIRHMHRDRFAKIKQLQDKEQQNVAMKVEAVKNQLQLEKEQELSKLRESLNKEHNAEVQKLLRQKENEIKQMQVMFNKERSELQTRLNAAQKGGANTDRLNSNFEAEKSRLQQEITSLKEGKKKLEGELSSMTAADRQKASELRQAHDQLQQQAARLRKEADQQVRRLMNELKSREHVIEQLEKDLGGQAGQAEKLRVEREEMERQMQLGSTSPDRTTPRRRTGSVEGSVEEKDQMRKIWKLEGDKTTMAKQVKELESQVRPLMDKNQRLERKLDELAGTVKSKDEENRRLREQLDIVDTRFRKQASTRSRSNSQSSLTQSTDDLEQLKGTITDLKRHIADSEKRRELVSLRKKKSKLPSPRKKGANLKSRGVVETYFGYDEEASMSWDSESTFSVDTNSELDISLSEDSSVFGSETPEKDKLEASMQQLTQEHLQLQRAFQLLQEHLAATTDVEREGKVRAQLQNDLLSAQAKIEDLQRALSTQGQDTGWVEEKERLNLENRQLQDRIQELEGVEKQLQHQVSDTEEQMELLEFRILELEEKERSSPLLKEPKDFVSGEKTSSVDGAKRQFANSDDDYSAIQRLCNDEGLQDINVFEMKRKLEDVTQKEDLDSEEQLVLLQARTILDLVDKKLKHWRSLEDDLGKTVEKLTEEKTALTRQMSQSEDDHGATQQHLQAANQRIKDLEVQSVAEVQSAREATATVIQSLEDENAQLKLMEAKARAEKDVARQQADKLEGIVEELKQKLQSSTQGRTYENELLFQNLDKLKEAQKRLSDLEQEEERHKAYIKQLEDIRASYESDPESPLALSSTDILQKVTELETRKKELENAPHEDTSSLKERIQDLEESERKLKEKIDDLSVQGDSLKEENSQLKERVTLLEGSDEELRVLVEELSTSELSLKSENTELKEQILRLSENSLQDVDGQKERIEDLEENINRYKELIDKLTDSSSKLEAENADLKDKLQDLEVQKHSVEDSTATSPTGSIELQNRIRKVEEENRKIKSQAEDLAATESILREENHNLKEIIEDIEKQASEFKEMMDKMTASEKRLEDKNAKLRDEVSRLKAMEEENDRLKMEAKKHNNTQEELAHALESVRAAEVELKKECLSLREKIWLLEEKETTLKEVVKDFKTTEGDLQDQNNRLKDELEDLQETMKELEIAGSSLPGFSSEGPMSRGASMDLDEDETELWKKLENWEFKRDSNSSVSVTKASEEKETQTETIEDTHEAIPTRDTIRVENKETQTVNVAKEVEPDLRKTSLTIRIPKILEEKNIQTEGQEEANIITSVEKENVRLMEKIRELEESLKSEPEGQDQSSPLPEKPAEPKVGYGFAHFWPDVSESAKKRIRELEANKHALQEELERVKKCESHLRTRNTELETSIHLLSANLSRAQEGNDQPEDYESFKEDQEQQECAIGTLEMATMVFERKLAHQKAVGDGLDRAIFGVDPAECRRVNCPLLGKHHQLLQEEERLKLKIKELEVTITTYREQLTLLKGAERDDLLQKVVDLEVQQKNLTEENKEMARESEELRVQISDLKAAEEDWRMRVQELEGIGQSGTESEGENHARRTIKELEMSERRLQLELEEAKATAETLKDRVLELERIERELREELAKTKKERDEANENDKSLSRRIHELEESESQLKSRLTDAEQKEIVLTESLHCANEKARELGESLKCANTKVDELGEAARDSADREAKLAERIETLEKSEQELMEKLQKGNRESQTDDHKQVFDFKETKALLEERVAELEASEAALKERVEVLEKSEADLLEKIEKANAIAEPSSELESEVQQLRKQVTDFENTEMQHKERIAALESSEGFLPQSVEKSEQELTEKPEKTDDMSELHDLSSEAGSDIQLLRRQLSDFEETEAQLRERIAELEASEQALQERVEILETSEEELMEKLEKVSSISQPKDPGSDPGSELQWLRSQLIDSEETETQLKARIADLEASEDALRETLGQADSIMSEREAGFKDQIEVLHLTQVKLKERIFELETSEEELKEQLFEFGVVFDDGDLEKKKERKKSVRDQETKGDSLADEIGKLQGTEEMSAADSLTESARLEKHEVNWENKCKKLEAEEQLLSEKCRILEESEASLTQQVKDLQGSEENLKQEVEILNDVNGSLEKELEDVKTSEKALKDAVNELQQENGTLKDKIKELEQSEVSLKQKVSDFANTEGPRTKSSENEEDLNELLEKVIQEKSDLEEKVQELEESEKLLRDRLQELQNADESGQQNIDDKDLAMENSELKMRVQELEEAETALNKRILDLRNAEAKKQTAEQHTVPEVERENAELKARLQEAESGGLDEKVAELLKEKEELERKVLDLEEKDLQQQERILEMEMGAEPSHREDLTSSNQQKSSAELDEELQEAKKRVEELEGSEQALLDRLDELEYQQDGTDMVQLPREELNRLKAQVQQQDSTDMVQLPREELDRLKAQVQQQDSTDMVQLPREELDRLKAQVQQQDSTDTVQLPREELDRLKAQVQQQDSTDMVQLPREELDRLKAQVSLLRETEEKLDDLEEEEEQLRDRIQDYQALQQEHEELQAQVHQLKAKLRDATLGGPVKDVRNKRTQTDLSWMDAAVDQYGRTPVSEPEIPRPARSRSPHPTGRMSPEQLDQEVQNLVNALPTGEAFMEAVPDGLVHCELVMVEEDEISPSLVQDPMKNVDIRNLLEQKLQQKPVSRGVPPLPTSTPPHFCPRSGSQVSQHTMGDVSDMDSEAEAPPLPNSAPPPVRPRALTTESEGSEAGAVPALRTSPPTPPPQEFPQQGSVGARVAAFTSAQDNAGSDTDQDGEDLPEEGAVAARVAAFESQSPLKSPGDGSMPDSGLGKTLLGGDSSLDTTASPPTGLFDPQDQINKWVENRRNRKGLSRGFTVPVGTRRRRFYDRSEDNSLADDPPLQTQPAEDSAAEQNVKELMETIEQLQKDNQVKDEALKDLQKALEDLQGDMKDKEGKLQDVSKAERQLQEDIKKHARDLAHGREEIQYLEQTLRDKEEDLRKLREDQRQLEKDLRAKEDAMASSTQMREKVLGQEKELHEKDDYLRNLEKQCRELKQEVERLKRELEKKERDSDITYYKAQAQMKEGEIRQKDEELHRLRTENRKLEGEGQQADRQCRKLQKEKDGLQAQVARLQQLEHRCAELQKLQDTLKKENDQLLRKAEKLQKADQEINLLRETVATLRAHLRDIEAVDKEKEDLRARLDAISDLKQRMEAIPTSDYDTDHPSRSSPYMMTRTLPADLNMKDWSTRTPTAPTDSNTADMDELGCRCVCHLQSDVQVSSIIDLEVRTALAPLQAKVSRMRVKCRERDVMIMSLLDELQCSVDPDVTIVRTAEDLASEMLEEYDEPISPISGSMGNLYSYAAFGSSSERSSGQADSGRASDNSRRQMVRHSTPTTGASTSPSPSGGTRSSPMLDDVDVLPTRLDNRHAIRDDLDMVPVRRRRKQRPKLTAGKSSPEQMLELHQTLQNTHTNNYDVPFLPLPLPKLDSPERRTRRPRTSPKSDGDRNRHGRDKTPHRSGTRSHTSRSQQSPQRSGTHSSPQDALSRSHGPNWYPPPLNDGSSQLALTNGVAEPELTNGRSVPNLANGMPASLLANGHGVPPLTNGVPASLLTNGHGAPHLANGLPASLLSNGFGGDRARHGSGASGSWLTVSSTADALSTVSQTTTSPRQQGPPQPPSDLRILRVVGKSSVLVGWTLPTIDDMGNSNGVQVSGYKIKVDGEEVQVVPSSHVSKALVEGLDLTVPFILSVQTISTDKQLSDRVEVEFTDLQEALSVLTSSRPSSALSEDTSVYSDPVIEEPPRLYLAVYNYSPSRNSPNHYPEDELGLREGDVVTVFGPLREDGFYEGKVDGRRGLVPASFLEEISTSQDRPPTDTHRKQQRRSPSKKNVSKQKDGRGGPRHQGATTHKDRRQRIV